MNINGEKESRGVFSVPKENYSSAYSEIVSVASSIISAIQLPDPDESIYQNAPPRIRRRGYTLLDGDYTCVHL
jgi:hypothetical protein